MKYFIPELIARAKQTQTPEELMELAKANGIELTPMEATTYFEQLHASRALSDNELDTVAGGSEGGCGNDDENEDSTNTSLTRMRCPFCDHLIPRSASFAYSCPKCGKVVGNWIQ